MVLKVISWRKGTIDKGEEKKEYPKMTQKTDFFIDPRPTQKAIWLVADDFFHESSKDR